MAESGVAVKALDLGATTYTERTDTTSSGQPLVLASLRFERRRLQTELPGNAGFAYVDDPTTPAAPTSFQGRCT